MFEGYFGYSLPDDLLSVSALRRAVLDHAGSGHRNLDALGVFGGDFPGGLGYQ